MILIELLLTFLVFFLVSYFLVLAAGLMRIGLGFLPGVKLALRG